ncbi:BamA/TamA family outer membrane protein [Pseudoflavitalea sp. G-6-1-2]|uniref:BamA/TamA family outer membrane protein n=1 Tax=Pseudoflavitalea sp. G-6-1-2 TaxID=2728841 RepID=UPI00146D7C2C|nr:BamA/TamA family outer membrane protein [Pseudoflavitalea sp. G-6-1-2]NML19661.1 BamA/TamA family outer membrane protein [Pseudoflavitalea sp. G-6-1-2]
MIRIFTWLVLFFSIATTASAQDTLAYRIILVGDAGKQVNGRHPELELMKQRLDLNNGHTTVLFLGDNVYQNGLVDEGAANYPEKKRILDDQINSVKDTKAEAWFVPGNHDWNKGKRDGLQQILRQGRYVESLQLPNVHFAPLDGCPGPVEVALNDQITLLIIDSQWWFQREGRPGKTSGCDCKTDEELTLAIKDALYRNRNKLVIFAAHHPFRTHGEHGGYYTFKHHLFPLTEVNKSLYIPLPVIGSIYPLGRSWFGNIQDMPHAVYKSYIRSLDTLLNKHPYAIRVGGHEHTLQYMAENGQQHIVSGAGSKQSQVKYGKDTRYANEGPGFGVLDVSVNGNIKLTFYSSLSKEPNNILYQTDLPAFKPGHYEYEIGAIPVLKDSETVIAAHYYKAKGFKKWFLGENYRAEWTTPLKVQVLDLGKERGGLTPSKRGGGMQSRSLRLADSSGQEFVIRSIAKYPDKVLPEELRQTFVKDAVVDGISASYPFAALSIPPLAKAAGIPHANPKLVYVPDDPRLLQFRQDFGNGFYLFEEREPLDIPKTWNTDKVVEKMQEDNDNKIDQKALVWARMLDLFVMDFDRHDDQWRWGATDNGKGKTYYPIPRDRDQPFFTNDGVLPWLISRPWALPSFQGFRAKAKNISTLNFNSRFFDHNFLTDLSEKDWADAADRFIPLMTDSLIDAALSLQPKEILHQSAPKIAATLKERRKYLKDEALQYYRFLAKAVDVPGSDKRELFDITRNTDGSVKVVINKINKEGEAGKKLYSRTFKHGETKEIRLYGLGGEDKFVLHGDGRKSILVRIIGGLGKDTVENSAIHASGSKTRIYDLKSEGNVVTGEGREMKKFSSDPAVNNFDRKNFRYNILMPVLSAAFNPDDGVYLGAGFKYTGNSFRRTPAVIHKLVVNHSLATNAFNIRYSSDFRRVIGKSDIFVFANLNAPDNVTNFFGLGNETPYNQDAPGKINYYRARYNKGDIAVLLKREINNWLAIAVGPSYQYFRPKEDENKGRFLGDTDANGLDPATLYKDKSYLGGQFNLRIDNRDNEIMPSRGVYWQSSLKVLRGLNSNSKYLTQLNSDFALYIGLGSNSGTVLATRFGGGVNFGKYEFFQAQYLGATENLRGFRKFRFAGKSMLFNNTEFRIKVTDFKTYLLPGSIGILAFNDVGRVWVDEDRSSKWHHGYGGGIWIGVVKRVVLTASLTTSKESTLPLLTFGYQF